MENRNENPNNGTSNPTTEPADPTVQSVAGPDTGNSGTSAEPTPHSTPSTGSSFVRAFRRVGGPAW